MNVFQQFLEFMNGYQNTNKQDVQEFDNSSDESSAEEKIEKHEDMEAEFAKELSALFKKYGVELEDDEYENESEEDEEDDTKENIEKADKDDDKKENDNKEKKEDKEDDKKEFSNASDFNYFKQQHNKVIKAAPAVDYQSIEDQRKLGKEIW